MTVNESISLLIDGLIVTTMTTSDSFKPKCSVLKDTRPAGGEGERENAAEAGSQASGTGQPAAPMMRPTCSFPNYSSV